MLLLFSTFKMKQRANELYFFFCNNFFVFHTVAVEQDQDNWLEMYWELNKTNKLGISAIHTYVYIIVFLNCDFIKLKMGIANTAQI